MSSSAIKLYVQALEAELAAGRPGEHSYRPALKALLEAAGEGGVQAQNEPARDEVGALDLVVSNPTGTIGHVEAKDIGKDLDAVAESEQLKRYRAGLRNLILTDYLEFRHYIDGELAAGPVRLGRKDGKRIVAAKGGAEALIALLATFLSASPEGAKSAHDLARRMADMAHLLRDVIESGLKADLQDRKQTSLTHHFASFKTSLRPDLDEPSFADMYAQTIAYGLLAARIEHGTANAKAKAKAKDKDAVTERFQRRDAAYKVPKTNPLLFTIFSEVAGPTLDQRLVWTVENIVELLASTYPDQLLNEWDEYKRGNDWVVSFYEDFLRQYDPKERERRGVYYTPAPVINFIVRAIDDVLKRDFGLKQGLADTSRLPDGTHRVQILDPATGTGSFLFGVIKHIEAQFTGKRGNWDSYVHEHLLPRLHGFELQMAPYTVAHLKLGRMLAQSESKLREGERVGVYLTNTLEDPLHGMGHMFASPELAKESEAAREIKSFKPILVVLGNPPYSGHSANASEKEVGANGNGKKKKVKTFIGGLIQDYYYTEEMELGAPIKKPLGERNPKHIQNDYLKFIRWAEWRIDCTGQGVLGFITDNSYLDGPTFRGVRQNLLKAFDRIFVLDLHGNSRKIEKVPEAVQQAEEIGPQDKNVFDIQQGVAICLMVKLPGGARATNDPAPTARVFHADFWGSRERKSALLEQESLQGGIWTELSPQSPAYLFVPQDDCLKAEYESGVAFGRMFLQWFGGPNSCRDHFAVALTESEATTRICDMYDKSISVDELRTKYELHDNRDWSLESARKSLRGSEQPVRGVYRPFDLRWLLYGAYAYDYHRPEVNEHLLKENLCLLTTRQTREEFAVLATNLPCGQHKLVSVYDRSYLSALYLYPVKPEDPRTDAPGGRRPNLSPNFIADCEKRWGMKFVQNGVGDLKATFGPEDVFHYMYAVFHSPEYRRRYADFLKRDFPRLPLTSNVKLLRGLCAIGAKLTQLHLMNPSAVDTNRFKLPRFPISGTSAVKEEGLLSASKQADMNLHGGGGGDMVEQVKYVEKDKRVWINKFQYFEGVEPEIWTFRVGGYQPCEKWLKDRKGRRLTYDDQNHYSTMCAILAQTRALMGEIDALIEKHSGWPLG